MIFLFVSENVTLRPKLPKKLTRLETASRQLKTVFVSHAATFGIRMIKIEKWPIVNSAWHNIMARTTETWDNMAIYIMG